MENEFDIPVIASADEFDVNWPLGYEMRPDGFFYNEERVSARFEILGLARDASSGEWGLVLEWADADGIMHTNVLPHDKLIGDSIDAFKPLAAGGLELAGGRRKLNLLREGLVGVRCKRRVLLVKHSGWYDDAFVLPHLVIGEGKEKIHWLGSRPAARFAEKGTLEEWVNAVAELTRGNSLLVFAISLAFSGPLMDLLGEPSAGFHFQGPSSTGKSTVLQVAGSVWGGVGRGGFVGTWRATSNGLEGVAVAHSGTILILDELAEVDPREVESVVYALGNGTGKARSGRTGEARSRNEWRVALLSSGEIGLNEKIGEIGKQARAGLTMRLIDLDADAGAGTGAFENLHGLPDGSALSNALRNAAANAYGTAGPAFVASIAQDVESARERSRALMNRFVQENTHTEDNGQIIRAAQRFALAAAAGEMARTILGLPWNDDEPMCAASLLFSIWRFQRGGAGSYELISAWEKIRSTIHEHGASRFEDKRFGSALPVRSRIGWRMRINETDMWLFSPGSFKDVLRGIAKASWVGTELAKRGVLFTNSPQWQAVVKIDGTSTRVVAIPAGYIERDLESFSVGCNHVTKVTRGKPTGDLADGAVTRVHGYKVVSNIISLPVKMNESRYRVALDTVIAGPPVGCAEEKWIDVVFSLGAFEREWAAIAAEYDWSSESMIGADENGNYTPNYGDSVLWQAVNGHIVEINEHSAEIRLATGEEAWISKPMREAA